MARLIQLCDPLDSNRKLTKPYGAGMHGIFPDREKSKDYIERALWARTEVVAAIRQALRDRQKHSFPIAVSEKLYSGMEQKN